MSVCRLVSRVPSVRLYDRLAVSQFHNLCDRGRGIVFINLHYWNLERFSVSLVRTTTKYNGIKSQQTSPNICRFEFSTYSTEWKLFNRIHRSVLASGMKVMKHNISKLPKRESGTRYESCGIWRLSRIFSAQQNVTTLPFLARWQSTERICHTTSSDFAPYNAGYIRFVFPPKSWKAEQVHLNWNTWQLRITGVSKILTKSPLPRKVCWATVAL